MGRKKTLLRRIARWAMWLAVLALVLLAIQVSLLAFPQIVLSDRVKVGAVVLYHDGHSQEAMEQLVAALPAETGGKPRYSIWEGDPAHTIAHELAHQYLTDSIGRRCWKNLPHWKQEGIPEYIANIGAVREDSTATLRHRIGVLNDDRAWAATRGWYRQGWDRIHYEAWLLVEYLFEVEGHTLDEIMADSVAKDATHAAMMKWYESQCRTEHTN